MVTFFIIVFFIASFTTAYMYGYMIRGIHEKDLNDRRKQKQHEIMCDINKEKFKLFKKKRPNKIPTPPKWVDLSNVTYNPNVKSWDDIRIPSFLQRK